MFLTIQYPIIDLREALNSTYKLVEPQWRDPKPGNDLRYFGKVEFRKNGGVHQWPNEEKYCNSRNAINLVDLTKQKIALNSSLSLIFSCIYRRFFFDGKFTGKFEMGFRNNIEKKLNKEIIEELSSEKIKIFNNIIEGFLNLKIKIANNENIYKVLSLHDAGESLAKLYLRGSTKYTELSKNSISNWWVSSGEPLILIIYDKSSVEIELPNYAQKIDVSKQINVSEQHGVQLNFLLYKLKNKKLVKVWLLGTDDSKKTPDSKRFLRSLRINLLRINAEKEALRYVLNSIYSKRIVFENEDTKSLFNNYIEDISSKILKKERFGIEQVEILDYALSSEKQVHGGDFATLSSMLKPLENKFIEKNLNQIKIIMGDNFEHISGSTIYNHSSFENSFNVVKDKYGEDTALAFEKVKDLVKESGNKEAGELFDSFNDEIQKEQPKKSLLKSIWEGLTKALPVISESVGIAAKIIPLFS